MHLEDSMVMYGVYSAETLEKLIKTVHCIHNTKTLHKTLFAGWLTSTYNWYINAHGSQGVQHYAINSLLYLRTIKDKYVQMYNAFITQVHMYAEAARFLAEGYLPILLVTALKLKEILHAVKTTMGKMNPDYDIIIKRLHLYYDMKIVTFGIDRDKNLYNTISSIHTAIHMPATSTVSDRNSTSYYHRSEYTDRFLHASTGDRPYIAVTSETYITIRYQELWTCKRIGYEFCCKELFVVKHKSKYSCKSAKYFDLDPEIIKENCKFTFYYNKTDITPTGIRWWKCNYTSILAK